MARPLTLIPSLGVALGLSLGCSLAAPPNGSRGTGGALSAGGSSSGGASTSGGSTGVDRSCERASDCALVAATCCGNCGVPSTSDMTAVRKGNESAHSASVCIGEYACPDCAAFSNPNLFALCDPDAAGCFAADLNALPEAKCTSDSDCIVKPRACCECGADGSPENLVALRTDALSFLTSALCEANEACDGCLWQAPPGVSAVCNAGVCAVRDASTL